MMYDAIGMVIITNSHFLCNRVPSHKVENFSGGGGLYIEFSYCKSDTTDFTACHLAVDAKKIHITPFTTVHLLRTLVHQSGRKLLNNRAVWGLEFVMKY